MFELSAFLLFMVANLRFQPSFNTKLPNIRILWLTVRRITILIWEFRGLRLYVPFIGETLNSLLLRKILFINFFRLHSFTAWSKHQSNEVDTSE